MTENRITKQTFHEYFIENKHIFHIETGELVSNIDDVLSYMKLAEEYYDLLSTEQIQAKKEMYNNKWNSKHRFTKLYQVKSSGLIQLSYKAKSLLFTFLCLLTKSQNVVLYKGKPPTNKDLMKLSGLNRDSLTKSLKELEDNNIIYRTSNRRDRNILFNPYYAFNGQNLLNDTQIIFDHRQEVLDKDNKS